MRNKILLAIVVMFTLVATMAAAVPQVEYVKIDGDIHQPGDQLVVKRGETLDIRVKIQAEQEEDNVKVEAYIDGYEYDNYESVSDSENIFDMDMGDTEFVDLVIRIPERAEKDYYDLKVRVGTRRGASFEAQYRINLKGQRHEIIIRDILMPSEVVAGRGFFANVKLKNIGQKDEDDVTVRLKIPDLNVEGYTTIDEIEADDSTTSEDIVIRIDACAKEGEYDVLAIAEFNEFEQVVETTTLFVKESDACDQREGKEKTLISVPQPQEVLAGQAIVFPIMLTNLGKKAKTYVVTVSRSVDAFGTYRIDPSNVVIVQPDQPKTVFVYVTVSQDASQGAKDFIVSIESGTDKQDIALTANVVGESKSSTDLKKVLESALVVLLVLLVIVGLVFGFNKLKPKEEDEEELGSSDEELGQTYY
ncbi:hypothetical protein GOV08_02670 [Candidatus Woesearchaeota archaeon]|nr:hypothetical protein [Candidatus Woesearchaeota archaeon]